MVELDTEPKVISALEAHTNWCDAYWAAYLKANPLNQTEI